MHRLNPDSYKSQANSLTPTQPQPKTHYPKPKTHYPKPKTHYPQHMNTSMKTKALSRSDSQDIIYYANKHIPKSRLIAFFNFTLDNTNTALTQYKRFYLNENFLRFFVEKVFSEFSRGNQLALESRLNKSTGEDGKGAIIYKRLKPHGGKTLIQEDSVNAFLLLLLEQEGSAPSVSTIASLFCLLEKFESRNVVGYCR
jgi:hypothetical protein